MNRKVGSHVKMVLNNPGSDPRLVEMKEYYTIVALLSGLEFLNGNLQQAEQQLAEQREELNNQIFFWHGNIDPDFLLFNHFVWYANSACNLLSLIENSLWPEAKVGDKFASLFTWRNKVAAHLSAAQPRKDSPEIQNSSLMQSVEIGQGRYYVGQTYITSDSPTIANPSVRWRWSLTETHRKVLDLVNTAFAHYLANLDQAS